MLTVNCDRLVNALLCETIAENIVFTIGLVGFHLCFDKKEEELRCHLERVLNTEEVSRLHSCKGCPFREGAIDVEKVEEERE